MIITLTYVYDRDTAKCHRYVLQGDLPDGLVYFPEKIYFEKDTELPKSITINVRNKADAKNHKLRKVK